MRSKWLFAVSATAAFISFAASPRAFADLSPVPTTKAERALAAPLVVNCPLEWNPGLWLKECEYMKSLFIVAYFRAMHGDTANQELMWSWLHVGKSEGVHYNPMLGCAFRIVAAETPGMHLPSFTRSRLVKCKKVPDASAESVGLKAEIAFLTSKTNRHLSTSAKTTSN